MSGHHVNQPVPPCRNPQLSIIKLAGQTAAALKRPPAVEVHPGPITWSYCSNWGSSWDLQRHQLTVKNVRLNRQLIETAPRTPPIFPKKCPETSSDGPNYASSDYRSKLHCKPLQPRTPGDLQIFQKHVHPPGPPFTPQRFIPSA